MKSIYRKCLILNHVKYFALTLILFLSFDVLSGQQRITLKSTQDLSNSPFISGKIVKGSKGLDSFIVYFLKDHLYNYSGGTTFWVKPNENGEFAFRLPTIDHPGRITICFYPAADQFVDYLVEPSDRIYMDIGERPINDSSIYNYNTGNTFIEFSGRGSEKYHCKLWMDIKIQQINRRRVSLFKMQPELREDADKFTKLFQNDLKDVVQFLNQYKFKLTESVYKLIEADIEGDVKLNWQNALFRKCYKYVKVDSMYSKADEVIHKYFIPSNISNEVVLSSSINILRYYLLKIKTELFVAYRGKEYNFKKLYDRLKNNFSGVLREKLLMLSVSDPDIRNGTIFSMNEFDECVNDAIAFIKTPYIKKATENLRKISKGSIAYDFTLSDSSGNIVHLQDFKGKVILIDIWGTNCWGCIDFAKRFEEQVYPEFKDNSQFAIVSINIDKDRQAWITSLKTGRYYQAHSIKLFTDGMEMNHPLVRYYDVQFLPFVLLIDKQGKIVAQLSNSYKAKEIISLIKKAID